MAAFGMFVFWFVVLTAVVLLATVAGLRLLDSAQAATAGQQRGRAVALFGSVAAIVVASLGSIALIATQMLRAWESH